jgi:hypothetical protein
VKNIIVSVRTAEKLVTFLSLAVRKHHIQSVLKKHIKREEGPGRHPAQILEELVFRDPWIQARGVFSDRVIGNCPDPEISGTSLKRVCEGSDMQAKPDPAP